MTKCAVSQPLSQRFCGTGYRKQPLLPESVPYDDDDDDDDDVIP